MFSQHLLMNRQQPLTLAPFPRVIHTSGISATHAVHPDQSHTINRNVKPMPHLKYTHTRQGGSATTVAPHDLSTRPPRSRSVDRVTIPPQLIPPMTAPLACHTSPQKIPHTHQNRLPQTRSNGPDRSCAKRKKPEPRYAYKRVEVEHKKADEPKIRDRPVSSVYNPPPV